MENESIKELLQKAAEAELAIKEQKELAEKQTRFAQASEIKDKLDADRAEQLQRYGELQRLQEEKKSLPAKLKVLDEELQTLFEMKREVKEKLSAEELPEEVKEIYAQALDKIKGEQRDVEEKIYTLERSEEMINVASAGHLEFIHKTNREAENIFNSDDPVSKEVVAQVQEEAMAENTERGKEKQIAFEEDKITKLQQLIDKLRIDLAKFEIAKQFRATESEIKYHSRESSDIRAAINQISGEIATAEKKLDGILKDKTIFGKIRDKYGKQRTEDLLKELKTKLNKFKEELQQTQRESDSLQEKRAKLEKEVREKQIGTNYFTPDINLSISIVNREIKEFSERAEQARKAIEIIKNK